MKYATLLLVPLALLVTSCGGPKKKPRYAVGPAPTVVTSKPAQEQAVYDEELGAFVVNDDDNAFSAAAAARQQEEELTVSEQTSGDLQADSARYGLKPVFQEYNKYKIADLRPDQQPVLKENLAVVKNLAQKGYKISIEGHACDSAGSTEYNMMLSEDRARAVKDYFKKHGVHGKLYIIGHGCAHLRVPSGNREQQAPNRRVEIYAYASKES